ncbi:DUF1795 domain-containing protein [Duganella sp. BJB488]|nr:DUF1795 domain-containing protein [Duganella sp. BJB489]RFP20059.1 DUF1795 domain-containing protein [Duganella sp. BJB488]
MNYQINEGSFALPPQAQDRSVNMLVLNHGPGGLTLVVSRDMAQDGEALDAMLRRQLRTLGSQVKNFKQQDPIAVQVGEARLSALQVSTSFKQNNATVYQLQTMVALGGGCSACVYLDLRLSADAGAGCVCAATAGQLHSGGEGLIPHVPGRRSPERPNRTHIHDGDARQNGRLSARRGAGRRCPHSVGGSCRRGNGSDRWFRVCGGTGHRLRRQRRDGGYWAKRIYRQPDQSSGRQVHSTFNRRQDH